MRLAICTIALLAGCSQSEISRAEEKVSASLKDPESAVFREVRRCSGDETMFTGEVNAKNSYGGYTGFDSFVLRGDDVIFQSAGAVEYSSALLKCIE